MSPALPLKESARQLISEVARALEPRFGQITESWREQVVREFGFDPRTVAALKRVTIDTGASYFRAGDFASFFENVHYFGTRLSKLDVDTRAVDRCLEIYQNLCEPWLTESFGERRADAVGALDMLSSATFVAVSGAYFDSKSAESAALLAVLEAELSASDLNTLLHDTLLYTARTFDAAFGVLLLLDEEAAALTISGVTGTAVAEMGNTVPLSDPLAGQIAQSREAQIVLDTTADQRVTTPALRQKPHSLWAVPLKDTRDRLAGVLLLGFDKTYYEWLPRERQLMQAMGDRIALAMERARMTDALREREALIARLSAHLLTAQEEERKRISRELHDETGQALMVIRLYLSMLDGIVKPQPAHSKIRETVDVVDRTIEGIRRIIAKLSPLLLEELGLVAAIRKEAKELTKNTGVRARVVVGDEIGRLPAGMEAAIYRIVQEALHNVAKHAQARTVTVQMWRENNGLRLLIDDDGIGMAAASQKSSSRGHSFGVAGIKERVNLMGGALRITSGKGKGTRIEITLPTAQPLRALKAASPAVAAAALALGAGATQGTANAKN